MAQKIWKNIPLKKIYGKVYRPVFVAFSKEEAVKTLKAHENNPHWHRMVIRSVPTGVIYDQWKKENQPKFVIYGLKKTVKW